MVGIGSKLSGVGRNCLKVYALIGIRQAEGEATSLLHFVDSAP